MTGQHIIEIPYWHPTPLNKLIHSHWGTSSKYKQVDAQVIGTYAHNQKIPKAIGKRSVEMVIVLGPRQRACDPDAYFKSACDALVRTGYLKNDNKEMMHLKTTRFERGPAYATRIILEDL